MASEYVLVTGASGFIGEHLARHFCAHGLQVAGTFLNTPINIPKVATVPVDLGDDRALQRLIRDMRPRAIVHCAAATNASWCENYPEEARRAIVGATGNLVDALRQHAPQSRLIAFSTDLVFDGDDAPYAENAAPKPLNVYGSLKSESEGLVLGLDRGLVLRTALVYGPPATIRGSFLSWMVKTLQDWEDLTLFEDEWRTAVLLDDVLAAVDLLLDAPERIDERIFHAGGPERMNRVEMGQALCDVFGLSGDTIRPVRRHEAPNGHLRARDVSLSCERLLARGWQQTPFKEGLARCRERWTHLQAV